MRQSQIFDPDEVHGPRSNGSSLFLVLGEGMAPEDIHRFEIFVHCGKAHHPEGSECAEFRAAPLQPFLGYKKMPPRRTLQ